MDELNQVSATSRRRYLSSFRPTGYNKGRNKAVQVLWFCTLNLIFIKWWCPARVRVTLLRIFQASVGDGVFIKHRVRILWPWKLAIGNNCWIGEDVWLLNLEPITLGDDVCLSQGAFLITGSHDRNDPAFSYDNAPILIGDGAWVAARATILRGVQVGAGATVTACSCISRNVPPGALAR